MKKIEDIKVSIILPVYNVGQYLPECLNSIITQTHKNLEIILVNDGSKDNSLEICKQYSKIDDRIIVIDKENSGVSDTRNRGIEKATGEYICFSDSDDYLKEDYVEYLLRLAVDNDAEISLTKEMYTTFRPEESKRDDIIKVVSGEEATIEILSYNVPIGVYCKMFKKSLLDMNVRFLTNISIGEGFNFNTTAFQKASKVAMGRKKIYFYRRNNPTSATTAFSAKIWENGLFAIENIKNNFIIKSDKIMLAWKYANWHTHCDVFNFMVMANAEKDNKDLYIKCKKIVRKDSLLSFKVDISVKEKIRGVLFFIYPRLIPFMIKMRNKKYFK